MQNASEKSSAATGALIQQKESPSSPTSVPVITEQSVSSHSSTSTTSIIKEVVSPTTVPQENVASQSQTSSQAKPSFYRSGKTLEKRSPVKQSSKPMEDIVDIFERNTTEEVPEQTGAIITVPTTDTASGAVVDTPTEEEAGIPPADIEQVQPSAPSGSLFMRLLSASSYYLVGFAILVGSGLYIFLRRKPKMAKAPEAVTTEKMATEPEKSSPRLEQALKAMEAEGISEAANRLKEIQNPEQ